MTHPGDITHVRVFIDRAAVTRKRVGPASSLVAFEPVPSGIETATLRAKATLETPDGPRDVEVVGVTARPVFAEVRTERHKEITAEMKTIDGHLQALDDEETTETHGTALIAQYAQFATQRLSAEWLDPNPAFDKWNQTFDQLRAARAQLAAEHAEKTATRRRYHERRAELLEEERGTGQRERLGYRVEVAVDVPSDTTGELTVNLTYITRQAKWMPSYDARFEANGASGQVHLTSVALVKQTTGEDWNDIELVATTARPRLSEPPPELTKLIVRGYSATPDKEVVATSRTEARLTGGGGGAADQPEAQVEHKAPGTVTIVSRERPVRVELFEGPVPVKTRLEVAPMARPVALLVADAENRTGRVLLPGPVNVFRGPNYSGRTQLGFVASQEKFRLPLGTEGGLRITRTVNVKPVKQTTLTQAQIHAYETVTTVENATEAAVDLVVRDRRPVSRTESATVKVQKIDPATRTDEHTGLTETPISIAPGSKRTVETTFQISAPRGFHVRPPPEF